MKKKTLLGTSLSIVTLSVMLAFGGMNVLAEGLFDNLPDADYSLSPTSFTVTHSGYSYIDCSVDVQFGKYLVGEEYDGASELTLDIEREGVLSDGNGNEIPFKVNNERHSLPVDSDFTEVFTYDEADSVTYAITDSPVTLTLYIDKSAYRDAPAGTYTGTVNYSSSWDLSNSSAQGASGVIYLIMTAPGETGGCIESGICGDDMYWKLYRDGSLVINGTGAMDDFGASDRVSPWINCKTEIKEIIINDGPEYIGASAFSGCSSLTSVSIPSSVTRIGENAFGGCSSLETIALPDNLVSIGDSAFSSCSKLAEITTPNSVKRIGTAAFSYCAKLEKVTLSNNITSISNLTFGNCYNLKEINIPLDAKVIGDSAFSDCHALETITIPGSVEKIGDHAFDGCLGLKNVVILNGVEHIGDWSFQNCSKLTTVTIPASVDYIGSNAFKGCTSVNDVYCYADPTPEIGVFNWFDVNCDDFKTKSNDRTICHVPDKYLNDFKTRFSTGSNSTDVNVTFVGETVDMGLGEHLYGHTVSLAGDIGVNFYMKLSDELLASDTAKMVFTITSLDGTNTRTQEVYVSSLADNLKYENDCIFKCSIVAKEMTSTITAQMVDVDQKGKVYTYSVQKYAQYILANPLKYVGKVESVKAMLNYGASAQIYFNYNTENLANSILPSNERIIPVISADSIAADKLVANDNIKPLKVSLSLESTVTLRLSFKTADVTGVTFTDDKGNTLATEISGDYTVVLIKGIPVQDLNRSVTITASDGSTISYCPLRYCRAVLANDSNPEITDDLRTLVTALYIYNVTINTDYGI